MILIMKKIIYILSLIFIGFSMSCEDFLDAPSKSVLDESVIFANPTLTAQTIVGIIDPMMQQNSYRGRFLTHYGANTDIEWFNSYNSGNARSNLSSYVNSASNVDLCWANTSSSNQGHAWEWMYIAIERANLCIRGLRTYGNPGAGNEMGQLLGEVLTYRAIYYADLLKTWGDVPARFEPVTGETVYIAKSDRGVIYKQIIADLKEAEDLVGWPNENSRTTTTEGINKAFVKAFRARLCLAASGYSQYPVDGIRKSNDPELSTEVLYPIALQECKDVIESGHVHLEPTFESFFRKVCTENVSAGNESLWEIPFASGRGRMAYTFGVQHKSVDQYTGQSQGGAFGPLPNVFYDYDEKDTRRDVTCVPYEYGTATNGIAKQTLRSLNSWCFGKYRYEWMTRNVTSTNDDGLNKVYMRYAEVLLMAAEIENELGNLSAAKDYLKQIRQRAFASADWATKVDAYLSNISSKEEMFKAIVNEQAFEFCGEMERKQALIRWNLLKTKMDEAKTKMINLRTFAGEYANVPANLYYKYVADETRNGVSYQTKLQIYGLNRGEFTNILSYPNTISAWVGPSKIDDLKLNNLYTNDPDQNQFWPIAKTFIDASNGMLVNDYGY
jgi:starch-binding outer membrane protein, SusD/RagB family